MLSFSIVTAAQSFCHSFTADVTLFKVAQKSAVQVCQVATVVTETTQLVLNQFKNFIVVSGELNKVSMCQK